MNRETRITLSGGNAVVTAGGHRFKVAPGHRTAAGQACPMHLLEGALGACIALTLNAVAANKGIDLPNLAVRLQRQPDGHGGTRFRVDLDAGAPLCDRERKILSRCAALCDVGKVLKGQVQIECQLRSAAPGAMCPAGEAEGYAETGRR